MSTQDDDDAATVVVDLKAIQAAKQEMQKDGGLGEVTTVDLQFTMAENDETSVAAKPDNVKEYDFPVVCFDFGSQLFSNNLLSFPAGFNYQLATDLQGINKYLMQNTFMVLFLNYDGSPQAVNQISAQVKAKFPNCKTIIVAHNLDEQKVAIHKNTPAGATGYLTYPMETEKIRQELERIYKESGV
jgi:hypothetical protein